MEQILVKKEVMKNVKQLEEIIILGKLKSELEYYELVKVTPQKKRLKKAILKILQKAQYNAKYHEETIPISNIKRNLNYRNYGVS